MTHLIAHRGYNSTYPENTLLAFMEAIKAGAKTIELDIFKSADGVLFIMHDATLNRTTNGTGPCEALTWADLRVLDAGHGTPYAGRWDTTIPALEVVFDLCRDTDVHILIEVKGTEGAGQVTPAELRALIDAKGMTQQVMVQSFGWDWMQQARASLADIPTGLLCGFWGEDEDEIPIPFLAPQAITRAVQDGHSFIASNDTLTTTNITSAHSNGLSVFVWTIDTYATAAAYISNGCDGVISNDASMLMALQSNLSLSQPAVAGFTKVGWVTDIHHDFDGSNRAKLAAALAQIQGFGARSLVVSGDLVSPGEVTGYPEEGEEWPGSLGALFTDMVADFSAFDHAAVCLGNHDFGHLTLAETETLLNSPWNVSGKFYGSFDANGIHFVILDSNYEPVSPYRHYDPNFSYGEIVGNYQSIDPAQLSWLQGDLAAAQGPVVVVVHGDIGDCDFSETVFGNPPTYPSSVDRAQLSNRAAIRTILEASGKVLAVLEGHQHGYLNRSLNGILYLGLTATRGDRRFTQGATSNSPAWGEIIVRPNDGLISACCYEDNRTLARRYGNWPARATVIAYDGNRKKLIGTRAPGSLMSGISGATFGPFDYPTDTTWEVGVTSLVNGENTVSVLATGAIDAAQAQITFTNKLGASIFDGSGNIGVILKGDGSKGGIVMKNNGGTWSPN